MGFITALATALSVSIATATSIVVAVVSAVISMVLGMIMAPSAPTPPKDKGVKQRIPTDPKNKLTTIYGNRKMAGQITFADISEDNQDMYFIVALGEGPCEGVDQQNIYWADKRILFTDDLNTKRKKVKANSTIEASNTAINNQLLGVIDTTGDNGEGESDDFLKGNLRMRVYPQGGRCIEMENNSSKWKDNAANRTMPDTCYVYIEITYNRKEKVTGLEQKLFFYVNGKRVAVFNDTGTNGLTVADVVNSAIVVPFGENTARALIAPTVNSAGTISASDFSFAGPLLTDLGLPTDDPTLAAGTFALIYSRNPAEILFDYLTNGIYGCSIPASDIDIPSLFRYKKFCNQGLSVASSSTNSYTIVDLGVVTELAGGVTPPAPVNVPAVDIVQGRRYTITSLGTTSSATAIQNGWKQLAGLPNDAPDVAVDFEFIAAISGGSSRFRSFRGGQSSQQIDGATADETSIEVVNAVQAQWVTLAGSAKVGGDFYQIGDIIIPLVAGNMVATTMWS